MHLIRPTFGSQRIKLKIDPFGFVAHINCLILYVEENVMWRINDYHNMVVFVRIWKKIIMISKCTLVREFSYWTGWDSTFPWKNSNWRWHLKWNYLHLLWHKGDYQMKNNKSFNILTFFIVNSLSVVSSKQPRMCLYLL